MPAARLSVVIQEYLILHFMLIFREHFREDWNHQRKLSHQPHSAVLFFVQAKIRGFQQALAAAQTTCTLLVRKVAVAEKERNTAQGQRDTANTKVKTADKEKTRLKKDLRASKATSSALCLRVAGSDGERRIAKQEVAALGQRVADGTTEHNAMANELAITNNKLTAERKRVVAQEAEIAILTRHLANANIERDIAEAKLIATNEELTGQKAETAALAHCLENTASECYTAKTELAAANGEVAAKDAVIARQRLETSKRRQLLVARGHTNLVLECIVEEVQTRLKASESFCGGHVSLCSRNVPPGGAVEDWG